ncbi:MAG TPA: phospholipid scramblase-related protein [Planctomycetota bacterium]|nr:phospholipid scramblase-related protein [Planctomycetota bacterium]
MTARRRILIHQIKEWGEILVGFETRNRYELKDEQGRLIGYAAEEGGGFGRVIGRQLLGSGRKATIHVLNETGKEVARGEKPFTWFFHRIDVFEGERKLGAIRRRFTMLRRRFTVETADGRELFEIDSPVLQFWTFHVLFRGREVGVIKKQWSGLLKEWFTDADVFGLEYEDLPELNAVRPLLVFATLLVDLVCFENNQGRGGLFLPVGGE